MSLHAHAMTHEPDPRPADATWLLRIAESHRRELLVHCYRMLGSLFEAEDAVQETVLRAWRGLAGFEARSTAKTWLHAIATRVCLDALDRARRRILPVEFGPAATHPYAPPRHVEEPIWLEPYPDAWLPDADQGPEARYSARESVALAFLAALQRLPARQRAALLLRDVLGWSAKEVADQLGTSVAAVKGAVQRARAALDAEGDALRVDPPDAEQARLLRRWVRAWEMGDVRAVTALLVEDCVLSMPPDVLWFRGREAVAAFLSGGPLAGEAEGRWQLVPLAANGQPAFGLYERDAEGRYRALALMVLAVRGGAVAEVTGFLDGRLFRRFGMGEVLG